MNNKRDRKKTVEANNSPIDSGQENLQDPEQDQESQSSSLRICSSNNEPSQAMKALPESSDHRSQESSPDALEKPSSLNESF